MLLINNLKSSASFSSCFCCFHSIHWMIFSLLTAGINPGSICSAIRKCCVAWVILRCNYKTLRVRWWSCYNSKQSIASFQYSPDQQDYLPMWNAQSSHLETSIWKNDYQMNVICKHFDWWIYNPCHSISFHLLLRQCQGFAVPRKKGKKCVEWALQYSALWDCFRDHIFEMTSSLSPKTVSQCTAL